MRNLTRNLMRCVALMVLLFTGAAESVGAAPIYFSASEPIGFDSDGGASFVGTGSPGQLISAGPLSSVLRVTVAPTVSASDIQSRPQDSGATPSLAAPYIVDVHFTLTNLSGSTIEDGALSFTRPEVGYLAGHDKVGLDIFLGSGSSELDVLLLTASETSYYLPTLFFGDLAADASLALTVTMFIAGEMPENALNGFAVAGLAVIALENVEQAPEPSALVLLGLVLAALAFPRGRQLYRIVPLLAFAISLGITPVVHAADESEVLLLNVRTLAEGGHCGEATEVYSRPETPKLPLASLWLGKCAINAKRYAAALSLLDDALSGGDETVEAHLYTGIAQFHLLRHDLARDSLAQAHAKSVEDPQLDLYDGVLLLASGEAEASLNSFRRARSAGSADIDPVASFYAGIALQQAGRPGEAAAEFERAIATAPDSAWADKARAAGSRVGARGPKRSWLQLAVGAEYDSNIVLKGEDVSMPTNAGPRTDPRMVYSVDIGQEVMRSARWEAGVLASFVGSLESKADEFDLAVPSVGGWFDFLIDEQTTLRTRYDFAYKWASGSSFVSGNTLDSTLYYDSTAGRTELSVLAFQLDYRYQRPDVTDADPATGTCEVALCGPTGLSEKSERDRDGNGLRVGIAHVLPVGGSRDLLLSGGYNYHRYFARGDDYSYQGHEVHAGLEAFLPYDLRLTSDASFMWKPFSHPSSYPDPDHPVRGVEYKLDSSDRSDSVSRFSLAIEKKISDRARIGARYSIIDNHSNTDVFDYRRQVFGAYLTVRFQR